MTIKAQEPTYEKRYGWAATPEDVQHIEARGEVAPFFEVDGRKFYTRDGKPVVMPDNLENAHLLKGQLIQLPEGTEAIRNHDNEVVTL